MHNYHSTAKAGAFSYRNKLVIALTIAVFILWIVAGGVSTEGGASNQHHSIDLAQVIARARNMTQRYQPARPNAKLVRTLVMVPCHATYIGSDYTEFEKDSSWALEPYQVGKNLITALAAHMQRGVELALKQVDSDTDRAAVIFSGGQTRADSASRSEAQSYLDVVMANPEKFPDVKKLLRGPDGDLDRYVFTEEHARDSYENVLFSLCRFYEAYGHFPDRMVIVGFEYKRKRFEELHLTAIRWPKANFEYIGVDAVPPPPGAKPLSDAKTYETTLKDMYLCNANTATRLKRNANSRGIPYYLSVPVSVLRLLVYCGPELFSRPLPWTS